MIPADPLSVLDMARGLGGILLFLLYLVFVALLMVGVFVVSGVVGGLVTMGATLPLLAGLQTVRHTLAHASGLSPDQSVRAFVTTRASLSCVLGLHLGYGVMYVVCYFPFMVELQEFDTGLARLWPLAGQVPVVYPLTMAVVATGLVLSLCYGYDLPQATDQPVQTAGEWFVFILWFNIVCTFVVTTAATALPF